MNATEEKTQIKEEDLIARILNEENRQIIKINECKQLVKLDDGFSLEIGIFNFPVNFYYTISSKEEYVGVMIERGAEKGSYNIIKRSYKREDRSTDKSASQHLVKVGEKKLGVCIEPDKLKEKCLGYLLKDYPYTKEVLEGMFFNQREV